jgi:hypothetical protein
MEKREDLQDFSLLGGPLYRLGCRLGLVRDRTNTTALGLVLGTALWIVLFALVLVEGLGHVFFSIEGIGAHVRLLVTIPLLFLCETLIDPRFAAFVHDIVRSRVVPAAVCPALQFEIARIVRWKDSWLPEALLLVAAAAVAFGMRNQSFVDLLSGLTGGSNPGLVSETTWSSRWYWAVCATLLDFLFLRWLWRLALWSFFLSRVSKLELRLVPIHPDRAGGLGFLELVHTEFTPLVLAMSAALSASLAKDIASARLTFDAMYPGIVFMLLVDAVLFLGPLFIFSHKLWACRVKGVGDYSALSGRYVNEFERKWVGEDRAPGEPLLGSADIQSLADLSNSVSIVRDMRLVPVSPRMLTYLAIAALLPLLPLALFKYPITELLTKFVARVSGG